MKSLYLRVWLTIVALLALVVLVSGLLFRQEVVRERMRFDTVIAERAEAWAALIQNSLPPADADAAAQAQALREWSQRLRLPLALEDANGMRIAASESFEQRMRERSRGEDDRGPRRRWGERRDGAVPDDADRPPPRALRVRLEDGRHLLVLGAGRLRGTPLAGLRGPDAPPAGRAPPPVAWSGWPHGLGLVMLLALLFVGVAAGAYPVVRRLTRRLEVLKQGVEGFGAGDLGRRVPDDGRDEVAAVARSFNHAAQRIESLLRSNASLLANASHELRSPLARMKMAVAMLDDAAPGAARDRLRAEIHTNIAELDALVDEVLLASKLDAQAQLDKRERVDLHALAVEEGARVSATVTSPEREAVVQGDDRLLRRAVRNLLENARRYGGGAIEVALADAGAVIEVRVLDRGPGVAADMRERIFEPFFRMPGHAEREGGVGLGLSLVRQIAQRHDGSVRVEPREGGGSVFVLMLPKP